MSINDDVFSRTLKHRALLTLYEKRLELEIIKILATHKAQLKSLIIIKGTNNLNSLNRSLNKEIRLTYKKIYKQAISELDKLAGVSARYHKSVFTKALAGLYKAKGMNAKLSVKDLIIKGNGTFAQQITSISMLEQKKIINVVKQGMITGKAINSIALDVGRTGLIQSTVQTKTLIRTAITQTSMHVQNATYALNNDVIDGFEYVATLDSRTSLICGRLDGKRFKLGSKFAPQPPQHFNCRSTTVPIIKSADQLLNTNNNRLSKRKLAKLSDARRASINGQVPARLKYSEWLSKQDDNIKLNILGSKKRVDVFNTGELKLTQFSNKEGKLISLERLEELSN
jgi:SPP1 gp7 family putative phage head morphogenesis protein